MNRPEPNLGRARASLTKVLGSVEILVVKTNQPPPHTITVKFNDNDLIPMMSRLLWRICTSSIWFPPQPSRSYQKYQTKQPPLLGTQRKNFPCSSCLIQRPGIWIVYRFFQMGAPCYKVFIWQDKKYCSQTQTHCSLYISNILHIKKLSEHETIKTRQQEPSIMDMLSTTILIPATRNKIDVPDNTKTKTKADLHLGMREKG